MFANIQKTAHDNELPWFGALMKHVFLADSLPVVSSGTKLCIVSSGEGFYLILAG